LRKRGLKGISKDEVERVEGVAKQEVENVPGHLQWLPEQIKRLRAGEGFSIPVHLAVLGIAVISAAIVLVPPSAPAAPVFHTFPLQWHGQSIDIAGLVAERQAITAGPDGNIWFTDVNQIISFTP
jgi:hypothetical protein